MDDTNGGWVSANGTSSASDMAGPVDQNNHITEHDGDNWEKFDNEKLQPSTSMVELQDNKGVVLDFFYWVC